MMYEMITSKFSKKFWGILLSLLLAIGMGGGYLLNSTNAYGANAVNNPTPTIDISVSVPADYPGTFLDYKADLEAKLKKELDEAYPDPNDPNRPSFRITSAAIQIDTSDTSDWYVYDHYGNDYLYNQATAKLTAAQKSKQPKRIDPHYASAGAATGAGAISDGTAVQATTVEYQASQPAALGSTGLLKAWKYRNHIWSNTDAAGKSSMVFAGYYQNSAYLNDYMIYPASNDSRRTISFDVDAKNAHLHSTLGMGFLLNAGISGTGDSATLNGYLLFYKFNHGGDNQYSDGTGTLYLLKLLNPNAMNFELHSSNTALNRSAVEVVASKAFDMGSVVKKARIDVDLQKNKVTVQQRNYKSDGTFDDVQNIWTDQALETTGYNGFGPLVGHGRTGHGCSSASSFTFSDLSMTYEADAFDGLKNSQFAEDAEYKYFINLAGTNNDPGIPESSETYNEGIRRLAQNQIRYISNWNDGQVLTDTGIGSANGLYATDADSTGQIARYIVRNAKEKIPYGEVNLQVSQPLADFTLREAGTNKQALTLHLQHLKDNETVSVYVDQKSIASTVNGVLGTLTGFQLRVYNPSNSVIYDSTSATTGFNKPWITEAELESAAAHIVFNKGSVEGKYTFELIAKDSNNRISTSCQTYLTAYLDKEVPEVSIKGHGKDARVTITLTDKGNGIEADGITFAEGVGSGVAAYQINNEPRVELSEPKHEYSFDINLTVQQIYKVTVWDECGNTKEFTYNTIRVEFVDEDGNNLSDNELYKPYYVAFTDAFSVGDLPVGPASSNPANYFAGWMQVGGLMNGKVIGSNTMVNQLIALSSNPEDENVIKLKPYYSTKRFDIDFDANGGSYGNGVATKTVKVPEFSMISDYLLESNDLPTNPGYRFVEWRFNDQSITTQQALEENLTNDKITLKAVWEVENYKLTFDANGGTLGSLRERTLSYNADIAPATQRDAAGTVYAGNSLPTRQGYIFRGWSLDKNTVSSGNTVTIAADVKMPVGGTTVYAVWQRDTARYILHFDQNYPNASTLNDISYLKATTTHFGNLSSPSRSGYQFEGWFTEKDDGTKINSGDPLTTTIKENNEQTLFAHWSPVNVDYHVVYYVKNGSRDTDYVQSGTNAIKRQALTGTQVGIENGDIKEIDGYWFDEANPNNDYLGTKEVLGDGSTQFSLYYQRWFNIETHATDGGTIDQTVKLKEGTTGTVAWKAHDGYRVKSVVVDGQIRDDLLSDNSYTVQNPVHENHSVFVTFTENTQPNTPGGDTPIAPEPTYYTISTSVSGCTDGSVSIDPRKTIKSGDSSEIVWDLGTKGYRIDDIKIDGTSVHKDVLENYKNNNKITFNELSASHSIELIVSKTPKLPEFGGSSTPGYYTVTVNRYGGDDNCTVSNSGVVQPGESYEVTWEPSVDYEVYKVVQNKIDVTKQEVDGKINLTNISANYVIDIYFNKKSSGVPDDPAPAIPDYSEYVKVTTKIDGHEGEITPSATIEKGQDYKIDWNMDLSSGNREVDGTINDAGEQNGTNDYKNYVIESVTVNGNSVNYDVQNNQLILKDIDKNSDVVVKVSSATYNVKTAVIPNATAKVSKSMSVYAGQNYVNIMAKPESGKKIIEVLVNDQLRWSLPAEVSQQAATLEEKSTTDTALPKEALSAQTTEEAKQKQSAVEPEPQQQSDSDSPEQTPNQTGDVILDIEPAEPQLNSNAAMLSDSLLQSEYCPLFSKFFTVAGGTSDNAKVELSSDGKVSLSNIRADQKVVFVTLDDNEEYQEPDRTDPTNPKSHYVDAYKNVELSYVDELGNTIPNLSGDLWTVKVGENASVDWKSGIPGDYNLVKAEAVEGDIAENITNSTDPFTKAVEDNIYVIVTLKKKASQEPEDYLIGDDPTSEQLYTVKTNISGGIGEISGNGTFQSTTPDTVTWKATGENTNVYQVYVDGLLRPDLVPEGSTENSITFDDGADHTVSIILRANGAKEPTNIDKDADEIPDINIDPDGDGKPDINIDSDGDGVPDVNIDLDGDGKPDVNKDTDGDGKPDVNIVDKDGDGKPDPVDPKKEDPTNPTKPDVNIDTDDDDIPDVNIDITDDGKPDVNVDTDGDGDPDVNIVDKDGDGKPDPVDPKKEDPANPTKPDVNVVVDPETGEPIYNFDVPVTDPEDPKYHPTVNVDTDGDGKPDVNVDVDGDGTPDINIVDEDKNGKPDPIKPGTKPTPTINVDTDGDGIPDEGIDRNYGSPEFWQHVDDYLAGLDDNNGNDSDNPADNSKDKNDKSKKSKSSKTGDMTAPIAGGIALIALLSGLVLVLARRRKEN